MKLPRKAGYLPSSDSELHKSGLFPSRIQNADAVLGAFGELKVISGMLISKRRDDVDSVSSSLTALWCCWRLCVRDSKHACDLWARSQWNGQTNCMWAHSHRHVYEQLNEAARQNAWKCFYVNMPLCVYINMPLCWFSPDDCFSEPLWAGSFFTLLSSGCVSRSNHSWSAAPVWLGDTSASVLRETRFSVLLWFQLLTSLRAAAWMTPWSLQKLSWGGKGDRGAADSEQTSRSR